MMTLEFIEGQHLVLEPCDSSKEWMLFRDYAVLINGMRVTVPEGEITDLASVPAFVRILIDDDDPDILKPAVIHDFLYKRRGHIVGVDDTGVYEITLTRREADAVLAAGMKARGARKLRRVAVYLGVRAGGWVAWNG